MELTKLATRLTRIESLVEHQLRDELGVSLLDCQIKPEPNPDSDEYTFFFTLEGESPGSTVRLGGDVPMKMLVSETDGAIAQRLYSALRASYRKILAG